MKRLIICDTLYQIIVAIQMSKTIFNDDEIDFWITDHSIGAEEIARKLERLNIVHSVRIIATKNIIYSKKRKDKVLNLFIYGLGGKSVLYLENYEEIIFYSLSIIIYGIAENYRKRNHSVIWSRFEEGVLSYDTDFCSGKSVKYLEYILKVLRRPLVKEKIENYYCFFPELKKTNSHWNLKVVPQLKQNFWEMKEILSNVFAIKELDFHQKYIFFASSSDIDGHSYGETELVLKIAELVGKDNLLVKMHPRDTRSVYQRHGITVMENMGVPWEVYEICGSICGKCFLTIDSGSFINASSIFDSTSKGIFLFSCVNCSERRFLDRIENIKSTLKTLHDNGKCLNISIIRNIENILYE